MRFFSHNPAHPVTIVNRCGGFFYFQEADVTLKRTCFPLTVRSFSGDGRVITEIAPMPSLGQGGDILEPEGAKSDSTAPFLWQHGHSHPVGQCMVRRIRGGLEITAILVKLVSDMPS